MESVTGAMEDGTEDPTERRGSKLKTLKTRLFGKMKRKNREDDTQYSQSVSDITAGVTLDSDEDMLYSEGMLSSRALSHDSIFLADQSLSDPEPSRVLSQENVPSKIKALQMKLQQQNLHLGPPPLLLPVKRQEDLGGSSEDDGLPHSPPEISVGEASAQGPSYKYVTKSPSILQQLPPRNHSSLSLTGTGSEEALSQPFSRPLSPAPKPQPTRSLPPTPSLSVPISVLSAAPPANATPALDFGTPAQLHSCLDTSAARHRMSIKPRNQRASTKVRMPTTVQVETRPRSESFNNFTCPRSENENGLAVAKETARLRSQSIQVVRPGQMESNLPNIPQTAPLMPINLISTPSLPTEAQTVSKPPNLIPLQRPFRRDQSPLCAPVTASSGPHQTPEAKPMPSKLPPTTATQPEHKGEVTGEVKSSALLTKKESKPSNTPTSAAAPKPSSLVRTSEEAAGPVRANDSASGTPDGEESAKGAQRPAEASGSFRFSINSAKDRSEERPRTGSLLGALEKAGSGQRREEAVGKLAPSNMSQRAQALEGVAGKGEAKPSDSEVYPPNTTVKKRMELGTFSKAAIMDKREPEEVNQEKVDEVMDVKEPNKELKKDEEGKKAFGVTLRNTSLSLKFRSDSNVDPSILKVKRNSAEVGSLTHQAAPHKPTDTRQQHSNQEPQVEQGNKIMPMLKKLPSNISNAPSSKKSSLRAGPATQADGLPTQPGSLSLSDVKPKASAANMTSSPAVESQRTSPALKEAPSTALPDPPEPQAVPSEVSWMSLALEKTRSLQQLITSRLPRDFAGQTTARPQTQPHPAVQIQTETQTESVKQQNAPQPQTAMQSPAVNAKPPLTQATSQPQPAKEQSLQNLSTTQTQAQTTLQQRIMSHTTNPSEVLSQALKQGNIQSAQQTTASPTAQINPCNVSFPAVRPSLRSTHSPLRSFPQTQTENMSQSYQVNVAQPPSQSQFTTGLQNAALQQSPRSIQGLHSVGQPKPTTPLQAPVSSFTSAPAGQSEGGALLPERRAVWAGSVGIRERTASLEKLTERTPPSGNKVALRRNFTTETRASATASPKTTHKESTLEGKFTRLPESSPTRVPGKLKDQEDNWLRKNVISSSSPSSSPTPSSPLQSMSDSGQPSWMDMAKRKSMAWSDKTMD